MASNSLLYLSLASKGFQNAVESYPVFRWRYMYLRTQMFNCRTKVTVWALFFITHLHSARNGLKNFELGRETAGYSNMHSQYYRCYRGGNPRLN